MISQHLLITAFIIFLSTTVFGQSRNVYLLKNDGSEVKKIEEADYIRIIEEPDSGSTNYKLREFFIDNSPKFIGSVSAFTPFLIYEGATIAFNKNGKKSEQITYSGGTPVGMSYYFYPNGRVKMGVEYPETIVPNTNLLATPIEGKIISYYDSTGIQMVKDGNGFAIIRNEAGLFTEEGRYRDGLRDSIWNGFYDDGSDRYFQDTYEKGVFKWGVQTFENDRKVTYLKINEPAEFKDGMRGFYLHLQRNFLYPKDAREQGISGKMTLSFLVKADGEITFLRVYPFLTPSMEKAAENAMRRSPKWIPAKERGNPINSIHEVDFSLNLSRN